MYQKIYQGNMARKNISNKLMIHGVTEKTAQFCQSAEKGHV